MPMPAREIRDLLTDEQAMTKVMAGAKAMYDAVSRVYGPGSRNALLGVQFGSGVLSRDGVTVAKRLSGPNLGLRDRAEADAATILREASEKTNKTAGDGTTTTVVLGYNLLLAAYQQVMSVEAEERPSKAMKLSKQIVADARIVIDYLNSQSTNAEGHLLEVATVASGDPNIGELIADVVTEVGPEGGITIREQGYPVLDVEKVNGYYFDRGFFAINQQVEFQKPHILVSQKRLATNLDILPILNVVANSSNKRVVIVGDVTGDALNTCILNSQQGNLEALIVPPPAFGDESKLFMEDIATYVGAKLLVEGEDMSAFKLNRPEDGDDVAKAWFGSADRVQVNQDRAIIFGGHGDGDEIATRASVIKQQADVESNAHKKEQLEGRYSKLVGKIAIVNVGGSIPSEMEELRFRVEDAIEATKSAMQDGVLPGGGTMLVRAANLKGTASEEAVAKAATGDYKIFDISPLFQSALLTTFKKLMSNAAEPADYRLKQIQLAKPGFGFNLRDMSEEPIDLRKAGIWDATRAVVQTIENAASAAGALLTVGVIITPGEPEHEESAS